ncbi:MAG: SUMF1/EgtB/PvdO family nonheme iron enzyme [Armatimonadetes bacterium]|nr:SUMF1/EgtB/PvdO family nonheme iron enzyme [Armatimonadota bacterium]MDI9586351.1 SUMF1/EgtB/PvdO family nonheme iron enzyme [Acidobacteriota bacterium]
MEPVRVFVSYNHEQDTRWFEQAYFGERPLIPWLEHNIQEPDVVFWYDRKGLTPGDMLWDEIEPQINTAHIAILLINRGFMNSEFIQQREYPRIEERARARELTVIPIITRPCPWRKLALLTEVLGAPETRKPLLTYTRNDVDFLEAMEQILQDVEEQVRKVHARLHTESLHRSEDQDECDDADTPPVDCSKTIEAPPIVHAVDAADATDEPAPPDGASLDAGSPSQSTEAPAPPEPITPSVPEDADAASVPHPSAVAQLVAWRPFGRPVWLSLSAAVVVLLLSALLLQWLSHRPGGAREARQVTSSLGNVGPALSDGATPSALGWGPDDKPYPDRFAVHPQELGEYVWVPAGEFMMGPGESLTGLEPVHTVRISRGFWIGRHEVTVGQYRRCSGVAGGGGSTVDSRSDRHPATHVNWEDAKAYCDQFGLRLPTEAEWEYAARGSEGRVYPWGDEWNPSSLCWHGNRAQCGAPSPVGSLPEDSAWCGALDMAGNVHEWCSDWYSDDWYKASPTVDPVGPGSGVYRVMRGGSWSSRVESRLRTGTRGNCSPEVRQDNFGLRCVLETGDVVPAPLESAGQEGPRARPTIGTPSPRATASRDRPWQDHGTDAGQEIKGPDGSTYVWVPAGEFMMGSDDGDKDEKPLRRAEITNGFWVAKNEVTKASYRAFCSATGRTFPRSSPGGDSHPVTQVSWDDAEAYCERYGLALPTETQWEYAARGPDSPEYPWGNDWDPTVCCHSSNRGSGGIPFGVGSFPSNASWCGALDMAGNVWEMTSDWYTGGGPAFEGKFRSLRGGSHGEGRDTCRASNRCPFIRRRGDEYTGFRPIAVPDQASGMHRDGL